MTSFLKDITTNQFLSAFVCVCIIQIGFAYKNGSKGVTIWIHLCHLMNQSVSKSAWKTTFNTLS